MSSNIELKEFKDEVENNNTMKRVDIIDDNEKSRYNR